MRSKDVFRTALLSGALFATFLLAPSTSSAAQAIDPYPWCAYYGGSDDQATNCYFMTLQQCMDAISGNGGRCDRNPFFSPAPPPAERRRRVR